MNTTSGWEGILDEDEEIRWQGQPDGAFHLDMSQPVSIVLGLVLIMFTISSLSRGVMHQLLIGTITVLVFCLGFYNVVAVHFWKTHLRRRTQYALTNKRALITIQPFSKRMLKSYPITRDTLIQLQESDPVSIVFGYETNAGRNNRSGTKIEFERIKNAKQVYTLIRDIQKEAA